MNRQILQSLASDWTRMAKNDIRTKINEFMNEVDTTPQELAYALAISEGELAQILEGNGEITLSTFAKLLIATGNALEIKPIEQTPIGNYNNIPQSSTTSPLRRDFTRPTTTQRENIFTRAHEQRPLGGRPIPPIGRGFDNMPPMPPFPPHFPPHFEDENDDLEDMVTEHTQQPRDARGRFQPFPRREQTPQSKFATMSREKLVNIITDNLWDSEIDVHGATFGALVKFLEDKDKRINELKRLREAEADPKVTEFKNRVKENLKTNPHLREYLKGLLNED